MANACKLGDDILGLVNNGSCLNSWTSARFSEITLFLGARCGYVMSFLYWEEGIFVNSVAG